MKANLLRWALPIVVFISAYAGYFAIASSSIETDKETPHVAVPTVSTLPVRAEDHSVIITGHGEVVPMETIEVSAQVSGKVTSWHPSFVAGGIVGKGEVLFSVEDANYKTAVLIAEAELANAEANLVEEEAKAEVALRQARSLSKQKVTDLYLRKPQLLSAKAKLRSARANLEKTRRDLANCKVVAPYTALVVSKNVGIGQYVTEGKGVAVLHNVEQAEIHIPIASFDSVFLPEKYKGLLVSITKQGAQPISREGVLIRDLGVINSSTRMRSLVVQLDDPYALVEPLQVMPFGAYVEVSFAGKNLQQVYRLPQDLIIDKKVWVVNGEGLLTSRKVKVLRSEGEYMIVSEGILQGDALVKTVPEYPFKGMKVKIAKEVLQEKSAKEGLL